MKNEINTGEHEAANAPDLEVQVFSHTHGQVSNGTEIIESQEGYWCPVKHLIADTD